MLPAAKIKVAVLGATGAVGQRFIQLLENHPWFEVAEVAASERSAGRPYAEAARWLLPGQPPARVAALTVQPLEADFQSPVIMSALPGEVARELEPALAARGHLVSSNTSANRMWPDVPLLLPEVNADHIHLLAVQRARRGWPGGLVCMSNCTSVPVTVALAPLLPFKPTRVQVVSMQAVSGAGYPGVASLDIMDNVVPYIGGEEEKVESEPRKMLGTLGDAGKIAFAPLTISAACNRVPVLDSHLAVVSVAFEEAPDKDDIRAAWANFEGHALLRGLPSAPQPILIYTTSADRPQPRLDRDAGGGMTTTVGRLRRCNVLDYKFIALSHNTIRGAAGGAILNAELAVAANYVPLARNPHPQPLSPQWRGA